ncbi:MAG TPA: VCBS repeat-containing protein [Verrucomicrobiae bacterium]|jgi:hypothetical protein|nr:VCBS repeat-containing protein [Verrucomicrobiae bacterium]
MKNRNFIIPGMAAFAVVCLGVLPALAAETTFTKVTSGPVSNDSGSFIGSAWGDFNGDGLLDLFICGYNEKNVFYLNQGSGVFKKVTTGGLVASADFHVGATAGDFDNDGNLDLAVSAGVGAASGRRVTLYRGNGDGTFNTVRVKCSQKIRPVA